MISIINKPKSCTSERWPPSTPPYSDDFQWPHLHYQLLTDFIQFQGSQLDDEGRIVVLDAAVLGRQEG